MGERSMTDRDSKFDDLSERVKKFNTLALPGQSPMMHMGTNYLVNDLWREVELWKSRWEAERQAHEASIEQLDKTLNEGGYA